MKRFLPLALLFIFLLNVGSIIAQDTLVGWNFPNNPDNNIADVGIATNLTKTITNTATGITVYTVAGVTTAAASNTGWATGNGTKYWEIEFSTQGYNNVTVQSKQRSSNTGPRDFKIQYKLGLTGTWTDVTGGVILDSNDWVHGVLLPTALPSETFDQPSVYVRWIMTSDISANNTTVLAAGTSRIDDLYVKGSQIVAPAAEILTFDIPLQVSSVVTSGSGTVDIVMPFGTDVTSLIPSITLSPGAAISPLSGVAQNFSTPVSYVVTASNGTTTKNWTVNVTVQPGSTAAEILTFDIPTQLSSTVNSLAATVNIVMPLGTDITALIPSITTSANATISPLSGVSQNFTGPVTYTVTAQDGITTKIWTVNVTVQANNQAEIITFNIPSQVSSMVTSGAGTVDVVMPFGTNVTALTPAITISTNAAISPLSGVVQDFTLPVIYTVTAEDGTPKTWTVTVTVQPGSSEAEILTFDIPGQTLSGVNSVAATVSVSMPAGTDVTNLTPAITISSNAGISPNTGISQDFTLPVIYVVTAEDGFTTKTWTVTVTVAPTTIVDWNFPNNPDDSIADGGIAANLTKLIITNSGGLVTFSSAGVTTSSARNTDWTNGLDTKYWEVEFTTAGYKDITLASKQRSSNTGPKDFKVQYKIGAGGTWTDVPSAVITTAANWTAGVLSEMALPTGTFNKTSVFLRWIMTSNTAVGGGTVVAAGASNIDDIIVRGVPVTVNDAAEIITFDIPSQISSVVNSTNATVDIVIPFGTSLTLLTPSITISAGATINPLSGVAQDFSAPIIYVVTAQDGITTKDWTVTVTNAPAPSTEAEIVSFDIPSQVSSTVNSISATIDILMPNGTIVTALIPTIAISAGATISPLSGTVQDFTNPVVYVVTAEDGITTKTWTATVSLVAAPISLVEWTFPNNPDDSIADAGITANLSKTITNNATGVTTYASIGATTSAINNTGWDAGMDSKYWQVEFTTFGYENITLTSKQRASNTGPRDWKIQYRIGSTGIWTDIPGAVIMDTSNWTLGYYPETMLPVETFNQSSVYIRWIMTSDISSNGATVGAAGTARMDDIVVKGLLLTNSDEPNINTSLTLNVYPNPASENATIMVNNSISSDGSIEILSVDGKVLYREVFGSVKNSQIEIVLRNYSPGLYFVKAVSADNINIQKLIIK